MEKKKIMNLDISKVPRETNYSLLRPPDTEIHRMGDEAFRLMIVLRYCSREMDNIFDSLNTPPRMTCPGHPGTALNVQHAITCNKINSREKIRRHNMLVRKVSKLLMRNTKAKDVHKETYSVFQKDQLKKDRKRADITYFLGTVQHSVDVKVTSSWAARPGNNITRAIGDKRREYRNEKNVHYVIFDTAGNATEESLVYLNMIGAGIGDIREIQRFILEFTALGIHTTAEKKKQQDFRRAREYGRWKRRRIRRGNYNGQAINQYQK